MYNGCMTTLPQRFAKDAHLALVDLGYSQKQAEALIKAAGPGRAVAVHDWATDLLKSHTPGLLCLILQSHLQSAIRGDAVKGSLRHLYGIRLPECVYNSGGVPKVLAGAVVVIVAKAANGQIPEIPTSFVFQPGQEHLLDSFKGSTGARIRLRDTPLATKKDLDNDG